MFGYRREKEDTLRSWESNKKNSRDIVRWFTKSLLCGNSPSPHKNPSPMIFSCVLGGVFRTLYLLHCVHVCMGACMYVCSEKELGLSYGPAWNSVLLCKISNKWSPKEWKKRVLRWVMPLVLLLVRKAWSWEESGIWQSALVSHRLQDKRPVCQDRARESWAEATHMDPISCGCWSN